MDLNPETRAAIGPMQRPDERLRQIAGAIGCSVADFYGAGTERPDLAGVTELLALWSAIPDEAGRAWLLDCARTAATAPRSDHAPPLRSAHAAP